MEIGFGTELDSLNQFIKEFEATFSDGFHGTYDLVVGADGLHSRVRRLVFGEQPYYRTNWGGWVWWVEIATVPAETFVEHWRAGRFVGAYPTHDGACIFTGAPLGGNFKQLGQGRRQLILDRFSGMGGLVDA